MSEIATGVNINDLYIFKEENIKNEQAGGMLI